jgi:hypothetical protein
MAGDPTFAALWTQVLEHWDDEKAHGAFLRHCQDTEQLGLAAARYAEARSAENRRASADKKLEAVTILATSSLLATKAEKRRGLPRWLTSVAVVAFVALAAYALARALR